MQVVSTTCFTPFSAISSGGRHCREAGPQVDAKGHRTRVAHTLRPHRDVHGAPEEVDTLVRATSSEATGPLFTPTRTGVRGR